MPSSAPRAAPFLERALLFALFVHLAAMGSMALCLMPGMPGGGAEALRPGYVAAHPWMWRLGWLPWQLCALSDLLLAVALLATPWIPRWPALLVLLATLTAAIPEQWGELLWITRGIDLAQQAVATGDAGPYRQLEAHVYYLTGGWGGTFYALAAVGWTWCFAAAGTWSRLLTWLSVAAWTVFLYTGLAVLVPGLWADESTLAVFNGIGFALLLVWLAAVLECVLRRSRPDGPHGRLLPWQYPRPGAVGHVLNGLANSRLLRRVCEILPPVAFLSDITDVIYVNYLVEAERLESLRPEGLELQRLGPGGRYALFSSLTYRHGHFGPRLLGPLRRLLPSPVQTNWRTYVRDPRTGAEGIYFVTTAIGSTLHALAARLMSEGIPMHALAHGAVTAGKDGSFRVVLDPGAGSGPDADMALRPTTAPQPLPAPWDACFADYRALLAYCVPQDRALSAQPWYDRVTRQEIRLDIPLDTCEPLTGEVRSRMAEALLGSAAPLCFRVPRVFFRFDKEEYDRSSQ